MGHPCFKAQNSYSFFFLGLPFPLNDPSPFPLPSTSFFSFLSSGTFAFTAPPTGTLGPNTIPTVGEPSVRLSPAPLSPVDGLASVCAMRS